MYKILITLILFFVFTTFTKAQIKIDSVFSLLEKSQTAINNNKLDSALHFAQLADKGYNKKLLDRVQMRINIKLADVFRFRRDYNAMYFYCEKTKKSLHSNLHKTKEYAEIISLYGRHAYINGDYAKALELHQKALPLKIKNFGLNHHATLNEYNLIGRVAVKLFDYDLALKSYKEAIEITESLNEFHDITMNAYSGISNVYRSLLKFDLALQSCEKFQELAIKLEGKSSMSVAGSFLTLGAIHNSLRNYDQAIEYNAKAVDTFKAIGMADHFYIAASYFNTGNTYVSKMQYNNALKYYKKALAVYKLNFGNEHVYVGHCLLLIGNLQIYLNRMEKGLSNILKAQPILIKSYGKNNNVIAEIEYTLGEYYNNTKELNKALDHYNKSLSIYTRSGLTPKQVAACYNSIGKVFYNTKKYHQAIDYFLINSNDSNVSNIYYNRIAKYYIANSLMEIGQLKQAYDYIKKLKVAINYSEEQPINFDNIELLDCHYHLLQAKSKYYTKKKEETKNTRYNDSIKSYYLKTLKLQEYWQQNLAVTRDRTLNLNSSISLYEKSIDFFYNSQIEENHYMAFETAEKTKTQQLIENLNSIEAQKFGIIPDSIINNERELSKEISDLAKSIFEASNDSIKNNYEAKLFELHKQKDELFNLIKKEYPKYHQLKYNHEVVDVITLQELLKPNQTIIEYFVGKDQIFVFLISKKGYQIKKLDKPNELNNTITKLRNSIYNYESQASEFATTAHLLYSQLVGPFEKDLNRNLIIIPDDALNYIPFEVLLTKASPDFQSYRDLPYYIKKHQISYNLSATFFKQLLQQKKSTAKKELIAFAPEFKDNEQEFTTRLERRNGFENLAFNIPEAASIHELIPGELFTGNNASEENFLKHAGDYKIIHLSTHAKSNDLLGDYSFIAMSKVNDSIEDPNRIYTSELYNLNLNADMVVLSACETGLGELQKGEGIISLARAFTYAGAKSTINSLWSVNDASTKTLMEAFYKNIKAGKTKDQALREAKLSYLENEDMDAPYFWASFIAMGNMEPITLSSGFNYWWLMLVPMLFGLIYFVKRRK